MTRREVRVNTAKNSRPLVPLYVCGILGPFGGTVLSPMIPELRQSFDTSTATIAWGIGAFFFPFAALLLVSGTLGEKWGREKDCPNCRCVVRPRIAGVCS